MKIKLNANETYEINFPEVVTSQEFLGIKMRLDVVEKLINKDVFVNSSVESSKKNHYKLKKDRTSMLGNPIKDNKEAVIEFFKLLYYGSDEEKEKFKEKYGASWRDIYESKNYGWMREKWKLAAQDIGLDKFPARGEYGTKTKKVWIEEHKLK